MLVQERLRFVVKWNNKKVCTLTPFGYQSFGQKIRDLCPREILYLIDSQQNPRAIQRFYTCFSFPKGLRGLWQELWVQLIRHSLCPHLWKDQITGTSVSIRHIKSLILSKCYYVLVIPKSVQWTDNRICLRVIVT